MERSTSWASRIRRGEQIKMFGGLALATALHGAADKAERDHLAPRERRILLSCAAAGRRA